MPGLLKGGTGEVGQVGSPPPEVTLSRWQSCNSWQVTTVLLEKDQRRAGEAGEGTSSGHRVVPRCQTAQGLAGKAPAKLAFPRPFSDDCSPK